jgi:transcriptional regulator with XRE-family HTH domain
MTPTEYQLDLGARLRDIRQQQGMTLQQVEQASGGEWKAVVVGSYERGDRAISVSKLAQLAAFYKVPLTELLPARESPRPATAGRAPRVMIDLNRLDVAGDDSVRPLARYIRTIQVQRGDYNGRVLTLRRADLQALSIVLGTDAESLVSTLGARGYLATAG